MDPSGCDKAVSSGPSSRLCTAHGGPSKKRSSQPSFKRAKSANGSTAGGDDTEGEYDDDEKDDEEGSGDGEEGVDDAPRVPAAAPSKKRGQEAAAQGEEEEGAEPKRWRIAASSDDVGAGEVGETPKIRAAL